MISKVLDVAKPHKPLYHLKATVMRILNIPRTSCLLFSLEYQSVSKVWCRSPFFGAETCSRNTEMSHRRHWLLFHWSKTKFRPRCPVRLLLSYPEVYGSPSVIKNSLRTISTRIACRRRVFWVLLMVNGCFTYGTTFPFVK